MHCPNEDCAFEYRPLIQMPCNTCRLMPWETIAMSHEECSILGGPLDDNPRPPPAVRHLPKHDLPDAAAIAAYPQKRRRLRKAFAEYRKLHHGDSWTWKIALMEFALQCINTDKALLECTFDPFRTALPPPHGYHWSVYRIADAHNLHGLGDKQAPREITEWWRDLEELGWWLVYHECEGPGIAEEPPKRPTEFIHTPTGRIVFRRPVYDNNHVWNKDPQRDTRDKLTSCTGFKFRDPFSNEREDPDNYEFGHAAPLSPRSWHEIRATRRGEISRPSGY